MRLESLEVTKLGSLEVRSLKSVQFTSLVHSEAMRLGTLDTLTNKMTHKPRVFKGDRLGYLHVLNFRSSEVMRLGYLEVMSLECSAMTNIGPENIRSLEYAQFIISIT